MATQNISVTSSSGDSALLAADKDRGKVEFRVAAGGENVYLDTVAVSGGTGPFLKAEEWIEYTGQDAKSAWYFETSTGTATVGVRTRG